MIKKIRYEVEGQLFGVCAKIGQRLNFSESSVRRYFIYASFFAFGSPIIIYLALAFWMEVKSHIRKHQSPSVWEI